MLTSAVIEVAVSITRHFVHSLHIMSSPQGKYWVFTFNNPQCDGDFFLNHFLQHFTDCTYIVFQKEQITTPHFQGYVEFNKLKRLSQLKRFSDSIHWERRKGSQQEAIDYCSRETYKGEDKGRIDGPWSRGSPVETHQGRRTDILAAIQALQDGGLRQVVEEHPEALVRYSRGLQLLAGLHPPPKDPPEVYLLFGPTGVGKTRRFWDNEPDGWAAPVTDGLWFDGYYGQDAALFDDFGGKLTKLGLAQLLRCIDRYRVQLPVKGGFTWFNPKRIYITTNFHPLDWYDWVGRQQQYPALERRFTHVHWWKRDGVLVTLRRPDPEASVDLIDDIDNDAQWRHFWDGVGRAQLELDIATGRLVSNAPKDYFDF